jgi:hypothetical protein
MDNTKYLIQSALLILSISASLWAENIKIFVNNGTISASDRYDTVVVKGNSTTVAMTGGDVNNIIVMNSAIFNMSGGKVVDGIFSYDSSALNLSGANESVYIESYSNSTVNISGTASVRNALFCDSSAVTMTSPNATAQHLLFVNNSTFDLLAGSVVELRTNYGSVLNIHGGSVSDCYPICIVNISGGVIDKLSGGTVVNIIGYGLNSVPYGGTYGFGEITGYWNDGTAFSIAIALDRRAYSRVKLYDGIIPANCSGQLQGDLNNDCKVNFTDFSEFAQNWLKCNLEPSEACW